MTQATSQSARVRIKIRTRILQNLRVPMFNRIFRKNLVVAEHRHHHLFKYRIVGIAAASIVKLRNDFYKTKQDKTFHSQYIQLFFIRNSKEQK